MGIWDVKKGICILTGNAGKSPAVKQRGTWLLFCLLPKYCPAHVTRQHVLVTQLSWVVKSGNC
jgi:hypothetical protein